jgi:hypothetical protein
MERGELPLKREFSYLNWRLSVFWSFSRSTQIGDLRGEGNIFVLLIAFLWTSLSSFTHHHLRVHQWFRDITCRSPYFFLQRNFWEEVRCPEILRSSYSHIFKILLRFRDILLKRVIKTGNGWSGGSRDRKYFFKIVQEIEKALDEWLFQGFPLT